MPDTLIVDTPPFLYSQFCETCTEVVETTNEAIDSDGNGLIDSLKINLLLNVKKSGMYRAYGSLRLPDALIQFRSFNTWTIGQHTLSFTIPGKKIHQSKVNGPYQIEIRIWDTITSPSESPQQLPNYQTITTQPYSASDFQTF